MKRLHKKNSEEAKLTLVSGDTGSGKSQFAVIEASLWTNETVYANFTLKIPKVKCKRFFEEDYLSGKQTNCLTIIDEAYGLFDSRRSMKKTNVDASSILFQKRKRNMDLIVIVQEDFTLDIRYRGLVNFWVECFFNDILNIYEYTIHDIKNKKTRMFYISKAETEIYHTYYDSYEIIETLDQKMRSKEGKKEVLDDLANEYIQTYDKITKDLVAYFLKLRNIQYFSASMLYVHLKLLQKESE